MWWKDLIFLETYSIFFLIWAGLRDPILCSLLDGCIPSQNSGYKVTRIFPSIILVCYFIPPPSIPAHSHSRGIPSSYPIDSYTSDSSAAAAALFFAPSKSRPGCSHHRQDTLASGLRADHSHRSRISCVAIYCATVF